MIPVALPPVDCAPAVTMNAAALAAFHALPSTTRHEYGGVIYRDSAGRYCYSAPVAGMGDESVAFRMVQAPGWVPVALYHSHPDDGGAEGDTFSTTDVKVAESLHLVSYVITLRTGAVIRYTPGKSHRRFVIMTGTRLAYVVADGDTIGRVIK